MKSFEIDQARINDSLYLALRAVYHFERRLVERYEVGYQELCLLKLLQSRRKLRVGQIAQALELPLFGATRLVQRLELRGLVEKAKDPVDGRAVLANLSDEGRRLLDRVEREDYQIVSEGLGRLDPRQAEGFLFAARNLDGILGVEDRVGERTEEREPSRTEPAEPPRALEA